MRCPGQDMRFWKPGDIFETQFPKCGKWSSSKMKSGANAIVAIRQQGIRLWP